MTSPYVSGDIGTYFLSGNARIDPLLVWGYKWGSTPVGTPVFVTYSFPTHGATWLNDYLEGEPFNGFQPFTAAQKEAAREALSLWSEVANITFTEIADTADDVGDLRFGNSAAVTNSSSAAWAYLPLVNEFEWPESGDVWFDRQYAPNLQLDPGEFGFATMVHEIGHAIGLDHPFADVPGELALPAAQNNQRYTIMAYNLYSGATIEAYAPMLYDILAIQYLYGANMTTRAGDDVYTFSMSKEYLECIWDAGGHDTINLSNQTRNQVIDLRAGAFSSIGVKNNGQTAVGNVGIAYNVVIEDAVGGAGNDLITGNAVANRLAGGSGRDTMRGGAGNDRYIVDSLSDVIDEEGNVDTDDRVDSLVTVNLTTLAAGLIEHADLGGTAAINATGNAGNNLLSGNDGANVLDGKGGADRMAGGDGNDTLNGGTGADALKGGAGNDTYMIDVASDVIDEQGNADTDDRVDSSITVNLTTLAAGLIEHADLVGTAAINATGTAGNNSLSGNDGANILDGQGGADRMAGGKGADTYIVDNSGDQVKESVSGGAGGIDLVRSAVSFALGANLENLTLLDFDNINAIGNSLNNVLTGNDGANTLEGGGGNDTLSGAAGNDRLNGDSGADLMRGGAGNDRYIVDSLSDVIDEQGNADTDDRVDSSVTVNLKTLGAGLIEHADLLGTAAINATGNDGNNSLSGNDGANVLDGKGGADKMVGGAGNDTYIVNNSGDQVKETISGTAGGIDLVKSAKSFALGANVENLTLLGSGNINATGNSLGNVLTGNDGANILNGGGGNDTMAGGKGNDTYVVNAAGDAVNETVLNSSGGGVDTVESSITFSLATHTNVENLTLTGSGNIKGFGNGLNNTIIGNSGDNYLDGGAGNDAMKGGAGNDTYVINAATDVIDEEGNIDFGDEVHSVFSINLSTLAGGAIERATLLGSAATNVTGNDAENILIGNNGANILDGGLLGDIMIGGKGNDTYVVESSVDHVEEEMDGGIDLVRSWVSFDLSGQPNIENITLLGSANASAIGNTRANVLIGNDGNNYLGGSLGNDKMVGNEGDDIYEVDSVGDIVSETVANNANGGVDLVESSVSFSLVAHVKIEHLNLTGTSAINGTGNALDNHIMGNTNKNTIDGGIGNDVLHGGYDTDNLTGGAGADIFDFDVLSELGDTITDFSKAAGDKLDIHDLLVSVGYLGTDAFTDQYVSFSQNGTTTNILFDADGAGLVSSAVVLASLLNANLTSLDSGSFIV